MDNVWSIHRNSKLIRISDVLPEQVDELINELNEELN